ncbi:MAG: hypothetical protein IPG50_39850 [Myxococcales bacterium]|nr:hypothetical protein [Myxococcales bacterium]
MRPRAFEPKDDGGPIGNLCSSGLLEAALLAGKLVIDHHEPMAPARGAEPLGIGTRGTLLTSAGGSGQLTRHLAT